jgi:Uma2 family endonuclease
MLVDVVLGTGARRDVVQPDVVFISNARSEIVTETEIAGAPDLVIEILSRGTKNRDRGYKKRPLRALRCTRIPIFSSFDGPHMTCYT